MVNHWLLQTDKGPATACLEFRDGWAKSMSTEAVRSVSCPRCFKWLEDYRPDLVAATSKADPVNLPPHYRILPVECIDVTEHFNFCLGNAIKYIWRADHKGKPIEDLEKAAWYIKREIERRKREL